MGVISHETKVFLGVLAPVVSAVGDGSYIWSIIRGRTRPHMFSWIIWGLISAIVFAGQHANHAGPGSWISAYNVFVCAIFAFFAVREGGQDITPSDWIALFVSLCGLPLWLLTHDPLWSVILETAIALGIFYPTVRKAYFDPYSESAKSYSIFAASFVISFAAMDHYSIVASLNPLAIIVTNTIFVTMLFWRRRNLLDASKPPGTIEQK